LDNLGIKKKLGYNNVDSSDNFGMNIIFR
jgi:hypothetical protein